jgi:hypothetical protein
MAQKEEHFQFAGKTFLTQGTSGSPKGPVQQASGQPVRGDLTVGGRSMQRAGTSGAHPATGGTHRLAGGPTVGGRSTQRAGTSGAPTGGTHRLVGGPIRIS